MAVGKISFHYILPGSSEEGRLSLGSYKDGQMRFTSRFLFTKIMCKVPGGADILCLFLPLSPICLFACLSAHGVVVWM